MPRPEPTHKPSEFKFGHSTVRNIWAGVRNPHREGIFVEIVTEQKQTCVRCTDGNGHFWCTPIESVLIYRRGESTESMDVRSDELARKQHKIIFGEQNEKASSV